MVRKENKPSREINKKIVRTDGELSTFSLSEKIIVIKRLLKKRLIVKT